MSKTRHVPVRHGLLCTLPIGLWNRYCGGGVLEVIGVPASSRIDRRNDCPPPVENDVALTVTAPAASGQAAGTLTVTHCPKCGSPVSVANEPYCANDDCLWNNPPDFAQSAGIPSQRSARMSGNDVGLLAASRAAVVSHVGTSPDSLIPSRIAALSTMYASQHVTSSDITPIAAENKNARPTASLNAASIVPPVVVPPIITTRLSNLDINGRLVKRGCIVSWHGLRYQVVRVRMGRCVGAEISPWGVPRREARTRLVCESVQVVA